MLGNGEPPPLWRRTATLMPVGLVLAAAASILPPVPAAATTCLPGTGTSNDPFLVASAADLAKVGSGSAGCDSDSSYLQTADITLTGDWTPIRDFSGTYDGGGRTISGLRVDVGSSGGLFGSTRTGALVRRTHLVDAAVAGGSNTGGLIGSATATRIEDSSFMGSVTSTGNSIGGLVGIAFDDLGTNQPTTVLRSSSTGTVTSQGNNVGGLVGYLAGGGIRSSWSTADVTGDGDLHGGLVGYLTGISPEDPLVITGTATATASSGGGSIVTGDEYDWSLVLDLTSTSTGGDSFDGALIAFTLAAAPANQGSWSPDAIVWGVAPAKTVIGYDNPSVSQLVIQVEAASGAPDIDGVAFGDVDLTLIWEVADLDARTGQADLAGFLSTSRPPLEAASAILGIRSSDFTAPQVTYSAELERDQPQAGDLIDASARGDVSIGSTQIHIGGAVGRMASNTRGARVFSTGPVTVTGGGTNVGGLVGTDGSNSFTDSFWDTETSGQASSDAGTGGTTARMTSIGTFADTATAGLTTAWPIVAGWEPYVAGVTVWGICGGVNDGYPFLLWRYGSDPCTAPGITVASSPTVSCPLDAAGTLPVGTPIDCTLSGGDPDIDILWRAAFNPTFAEGVVRSGADGTGTIPLTIPPAAAGRPITVELVAWTAPLPVGTAASTPPVPTSIDAGGGRVERTPAALARLGLVVALLIPLVAVRSRRRSATERI